MKKEATGMIPTKQQKQEQAYRFSLRQIEQNLQDKPHAVLAFSSSAKWNNHIRNAVANLAHFLRSEHKVLLIEAVPNAVAEQDLGDNSVVCPLDGAAAYAASHKEAFDVVIISLPPVAEWESALACAVCADALYLTEEIGGSRYSSFENTLELLKSNGLCASGILACR